MKRQAIDWERVEAILRAEGRPEIGCPYCKDRGTVPYIAEHVLVAHSASNTARRLQRAILGERKPRSA